MKDLESAAVKASVVTVAELLNQIAKDHPEAMAQAADAVVARVNEVRQPGEPDPKMVLSSNIETFREYAQALLKAFAQEMEEMPYGGPHTTH